MAPEVLLAGSHDTPCDIYSVGVMAAGMLGWLPRMFWQAGAEGGGGLMRYYQTHSLFDDIATDWGMLAITEPVTQSWLAFLSSALGADPEARDTAAGLLKLPLFATQEPTEVLNEGKREEQRLATLAMAAGESASLPADASFQWTVGVTNDS